MEKRDSWIKVYGSAVLFSLIVGFSLLGIKICIPFATPLQILAYRFDFACLGALVPIVLHLIQPELLGRQKKNIMLTAGFYLGFMALQTLGLLFATSVVSGIIFAAVPILVKIISWVFLGEKGTLLQSLFLGVSTAAVAAMFVISSQGLEKVSCLGLLLLFLSSVSMAVSNVFMRYVRNEYKPFDISFVIAVLGCLAFNIAAITQGLYSGTLGDYFQPLLHPSFVIAAAFLGIPSTLISARLMAYMLAHMEAASASVFGNLSTAISIAAGALILREPLEWYHVICTMAIIAGVVGTSLTSGRGEGRVSVAADRRLEAQIEARAGVEGEMEAQACAGKGQGGSEYEKRES